MGKGVNKNMNRIFSALHIAFLSILLSCLLTGCGSDEGSGDTSSQPKGNRETVTDFLLPDSSGISVYGNDFISIDASNSSEGYIMLQYSGVASKVRLQVTTPDQTVYSYCMTSEDYETFPLTGGDGNYHMEVYEHAFDDKYALSFSQDISVTLNDEFKPFLYPNQYVWFTPESKAVRLGMELSDKASDDLDYVEQVYNYVIENITYDEEFAAHIPVEYIPDIDQTLKTGTGICFDYASLMAALLRSQRIPTKLVVGYSGTVYHAWISVYLKEAGWVDNIIEFDGNNWSLMDPTLAANNDSASVKKYIGDGDNYTVKYSY